MGLTHPLGRSSASICTFGLIALSLGGCSDKMTLDTNMNGQVATTVKIEGPLQLQMQMQGPTIRYEGTHISDDLLATVKAGTTTDDWILAVFGEPDARSDLRDGTQIWRWTYHPVEQQASMVELISRTEKEPKLATRSVFVQLRNRVVIEKWKG